MKESPATGVVKFWNPDKGWGAISSNALPPSRDAWVHFSMIQIAGYRTLEPEQQVDFTFHEQKQDSFDFVADCVRPH